MKSNMGTVDRIIRLVLGIIIIVLGVYFKNWWGLVGVVLFLTAVLAYCPIYLPFGLSTKPAAKAEAAPEPAPEEPKE